NLFAPSILCENIQTNNSRDVSALDIRTAVKDVVDSVFIREDEGAEARLTTNAEIAAAFNGSNAIINGSFDFWQRGTTQNTYGYGSADRWQNFFVGSTATLSRQAFDIDQTAAPGEPKYFARVDATTDGSAGNFVIFSQSIEGANKFAGKTVTVIFSMKADAAKDIAVELFQNFGTGGTPSPNQHATPETVSVTDSMATYAVAIDIPAVTGKTLGTDGNDFLSLYFWLDAGSNFDARSNTLGNQSGIFDFAQVCVVEGNWTEFPSLPDIPRNHVLERQLCERYYKVINFYVDFHASGAFQVGIFQQDHDMREAPTMSFTTDLVQNLSSTITTSEATLIKLALVGSAAGRTYLYGKITLDAEI
ncbi:MAG: hypothetical protein AAF197_08690, partial [Pseudomonadota bacterium]